MINDEHIPYLICRKLIGTITAEEEALLEKWRQLNDSNRAAYGRMMQKECVNIELHRLDISDYHRPLADMQRRIAVEDNQSIPRGIPAPSHRSAAMYKLVAAAAAVLLFIFIGTRWWHNTEGDSAGVTATVEKTEIMPGHTQAVLTLDNGETVNLGVDSMRNSKMIAEAQKGEEFTYSTMQTPRGGEFKVMLEDGTEVWLNADTRLRYPEKFSGSERRVEVDGEAYFKVAPDSERPFYVVSGTQEIKVYGTEFNVTSYGDEPAVYTTLVKGSISLKIIGGNGSELMLTPGHQAVVDKGQSTARVKTVDTEVVTSWRSGTFVFEDQTLEQIMRTLSRWYDFDYEFADKSVASIVFMGSIPRYGSFAEVADIFKKMGGIRLRQQGSKVVITAK